MAHHHIHLAHLSTTCQKVNLTSAPFVVAGSEIISFSYLGNRHWLGSNTWRIVFSSIQNRQESDIFKQVQTNSAEFKVNQEPKMSAWQYCLISGLSLFISEANLGHICLNCACVTLNLEKVLYYADTQTKILHH